MRIRNQRAFAAGFFFIVVAIFYFVTSFNYVGGTAAQMGPGFFPRMLSVVLALVGLAIAVSAILPRARIERLESWDPKRLFWITGSVVLFAVLLPTFGLVVALAALIIVSSLASTEFGWLGTLVSTVVLSIFTVGIFVYGISIPIPVWPIWSQ